MLKTIFTCMIISLTTITASAQISCFDGLNESNIEIIKNAKQTIYVVAHRFDSEELCDLLISAKKQNIDVKIIVYVYQSNESKIFLEKCIQAKIPVFKTGTINFNHDKAIFCDNTHWILLKTIIDLSSFDDINLLDQNNTDFNGLFKTILDKSKAY